MKKILVTIFLSLMWSSISIAEEKDNSHLENKFESYLPCDEHVAVLFKKIKKSSPRDYPYLFPENKLVSCNPKLIYPMNGPKLLHPLKNLEKLTVINQE